MPEATDAGDLISKPVYGTSEGRQLGRVTDVLFDAERQMLLGLVIESDEDGTSVFVDREDIRAMGKDVVTVEDGDVMRPLATEERARAVVESGVHLGGARVITEAGDAIGQVDRVLVDDEGAIVEYRAVSGPFGIAGKNRIRREDVRKIGADAIIVAAEVGEADDDREPAADEGDAPKPGAVSDGGREES